MKSRTNQPVYKDDGTLFDDAQLVSDIQANGGTKLYRHELVLIATNDDEYYFTLISNRSDNLIGKSFSLRNNVSCTHANYNDEEEMLVLLLESDGSEIDLISFSITTGDVIAVYKHYNIELSLEDCTDTITEL